MSIGKDMDVKARGQSASDVIRAEVDLLDAYMDVHAKDGLPQDGTKGGRDLRLHVTGEVPDEASAELLGKAAERWVELGGGYVWMYTHNWRTIDREAFGQYVSVFASVELLNDGLALLDAAQGRGYVPAVVVPAFLARRTWTERQWRFVPCPAELHPGKVTCATCRLCLAPGQLKKNHAIAFQVHGDGRGKLRAMRRLTQRDLFE